MTNREIVLEALTQYEKDNYEYRDAEWQNRVNELIDALNRSDKVIIEDK